MEKEMTIVVPVRNRESRITRTLDSIRSQTYRPLNLIIVDNGSTDMTPEIITRWAATNSNEDFNVTVLTEPEEGASRARNKGLQATATDLVMFFDSDDVMESDHLQRIMDHLLSWPGTELLHWGISLRDADGWTEEKYSRDDDDLLAGHILHGTLSTARFCVRTAALRDAGGWDEELSTWDDLELGVRLLKTISPDKIHRLTGTPRVIADISDDSLTGPSFSSRSSAQAKALDLIGAHLHDDNRLSLILAARKAILAAQYKREGARDLADKLLREATAGRSRSERLKLRLTYTVQRLSGEGGSSVALRMFPPEQETPIG